MARKIVLAWEHGRNLGHISRLLAISKSVESLGCVPIWVIPPAYFQVEAVREAGCEVHAAPAMKSVVAGERGRTESFADILLSMGFGDSAGLGHWVQDWIALFEKLKPDCVLLDYAPAAQLATYFLRIKAVQITNGFDAPPADCPVFESSVRGPYIERRNLQKIERINASFQQIKGLSVNCLPPSLSEYFGHPFRVFDCVAETDPYPQRKDGFYIGPLSMPKTVGGEKKAAIWPMSDPVEDKLKLFAYLRAIPDPQLLLDAMCNCNANALCVWPDIPESLLSMHRKNNVRIVREPVDITDALGQSHAVVNYGSTTTVCQALLMGRPQWMIPGDMEKRLAAQSVANHGAGIVHDKRKSYSDGLSVLLYSTVLVEAAHRIAKKYSENYFLSRRNHFLMELVT